MPRSPQTPRKLLELLFDLTADMSQVVIFPSEEVTAEEVNAIIARCAEELRQHPEIERFMWAFQVPRSAGFLQWWLTGATGDYDGARQLAICRFIVKSVTGQSQEHWNRGDIITTDFDGDDFTV